jgi:hypothetical protein
MTYASTYFLVGISDMKDYLHLPASDTTLDGLVGNLMESVVYLMENYCQRKLKNRQHTEYYDGDGTPNLIVRQYPITDTPASIDIRDDIDGVWGSDSKFDSEDIIIPDIGNIISLRSSVFTDARGNIKIVYDAGYATVPPDLKLAAYEYTGFIWKRREGKSWDQLGTSVAGSSVTLLETDMPKTVESLLKRYRRRAA